MADFSMLPLPGPVNRSVRLPGSKSLTNRALLVAALARGASTLEDCLIASDTLLMVDGLRSLGIRVELDRPRRRAVVHGAGGHWPETQAELQCGNAGTVIRFLTAGCCVGYGEFRLDGVARMRRRPIGGLVDALRDLGAQINYEGEEEYCPITARAAGLRGGLARFRDAVSSQFVSAVLLAAPCARGDVFVEVEGQLPSAPYVRMTTAVMEAFGVVVIDDGAGRFIVSGGQPYRPATFQIEPDATAASYFMAAAALVGGRITVEGLGLDSVQGDRAFADTLAAMGCAVEYGSQSTTVRGPADGKLRGVDVDYSAMPDVAPTLAVLAAFAEGPTRIRGLATLRIKECDRLFALSAELGCLGVETEVFPDGLVVRPTRAPVAAVINTYDDHRMAMSFALAGLRLDGVVIRDAECVNKTFPEFFDLWKQWTP